MIPELSCSQEQPHVSSICAVVQKRWGCFIGLTRSPSRELASYAPLFVFPPFLCVCLTCQGISSEFPTASVSQSLKSALVQWPTYTTSWTVFTSFSAPAVWMRRALQTPREKVDSTELQPQSLESCLRRSSLIPVESRESLVLVPHGNAHLHDESTQKSVRLLENVGVIGSNSKKIKWRQWMCS